MTIDWFMLLAPLILLPIVALLAFRGCYSPVYYYPNLQVNIKSIFQTTAVTAKWTFVDNTASTIGTLSRSPSPPWPPDPVNDSVSSVDNTTILFLTSENAFQTIIANNPTVVSCECDVTDIAGTVKHLFPSQNPITYSSDSSTGTLVWLLTRNLDKPSNPQDGYTFELQG